MIVKITGMRGKRSVKWSIFNYKFVMLEFGILGHISEYLNSDASL